MSASCSGPASRLPVIAMLVIAKPSGTRRRMGSMRRSSAPRQVIRISAASPFEPHPHAPDGQLVAEAEGDRPIDAMAVHVRPVGAALVLDEPASTAEGEHRVVGAHEVVLDVDRVVDVAPDRVDRSERDRGAIGRLVGRRLEHREAPDPGAGRDLCLFGIAKVLEQRPREAHQHQVQQRHEPELEDEQQDAQDVAGHVRTWNSISVSPTRMTSPGPSAIWLTGWPLTVEPLRLPRSAKPYAPCWSFSWQWWRLTIGSSTITSLSLARPMPMR